MSQAHSPFKFLDSYQQADSDVFFGREKETNDLYNALSGVKHLLVYGPSGSGKTSLVECGLRNQFSDADWYALTIRKGPDIVASVFAGINKALNEKIEVDQVTGMPADQQIEFGQAIEKLFAERYQPVYLLFDQFEELLISGEEEEKKKFFTLLNKLIRNKVPCRIMLIMREEFIGHLSEFEQLCPSIFQYRFRVEKMGRKNVEEVIYYILEAPRYRAYFNVDDSRRLTHSILSKLPDKKKEIELAHVQVFLGELWDRAQLEKKNNELPVLSAFLIKDDDDLEAVLESFLKKQIEELEESYGEKTPLELLAAMISERFTKLQLSEAVLQENLEQKKVVSKKPISHLLKDLEQRRIIRTIKVGDETQYELSHDVLALVVGQNLTEEMKMREKAGDIYKVYQERQGLFSQDDIDYLRPFQQSLSYPPGLQARIGESIAVLKKQREQERAHTRKRLRTLYSLLGGALLALIVAIFLGVVAYSAKNKADNQTKIAQANYLMSEAKSAVKKDPTLALRLAEQAMLNHNNTSIEQEALNIYNENNFYKIISRVPQPGNKYETPVPGIITPGKKSLLYRDRSGIHIMNPGTNEPIKSKVNIDSADGIVFSSAGEFIITSELSPGYKNSIFNIAGEPIGEFKTDSAYLIQFSPGGNHVITYNHRGQFKFLDYSGNTGKVINIDGLSVLQGFAVSASEDHIFTFSSRAWSTGGPVNTENEVKFWTANGRVKNFSDKIKSPIKCAAFSPDGWSVFTGNEDHSIARIDREGNITGEFIGHTAPVLSITLSGDAKYILSFSEDHTARQWEIKKDRSHPAMGYLSEPKIKFSPDGEYFFINYNQDKGDTLFYKKAGNADEADTTSEAAIPAPADIDFSAMHTFCKPGQENNFSNCEPPAFVKLNNKISAYCFLPGEKSVLTGIMGETIKKFDLNGKFLKDLKVPWNTEISTIAVSADGELIITGGYTNGSVLLWNPDGDKTMTIKCHTAPVVSILISPDGKRFLTFGDETAKLWDVQHGLLIKQYQEIYRPKQAWYSPNGQYIVIKLDEGGVVLHVPKSLNDFLKSDNAGPLSEDQKKKYGIK